MRQEMKRIIAFICMILILWGTVGYTFAQTVSNDNEKLHVKILATKGEGDSKIGYAIGNPKTNQETGNAAVIWNLVEYNSDNTSPKENGSKNIYCAKAGIGFTDTNQSETYDVYYDFKTEKEEIKSQNKVLESIVTGEIPNGSDKVDKYNCLLALVDLFYLEETSSENEEQKIKEYLKSVNIDEDSWDFLLTKNDIEAVQQAALWYFTNYYKATATSTATNSNYVETAEHDTKYDKLQATGWLNYTLDGDTYSSLSGYHSTTPVNGNTTSGQQRQLQAEQFYKYLIETAKANAKNYTSSTQQKAPVTLTTKVLNCSELNENYILGPLHISKEQNNTTPYDITLNVKKDGQKIENYTLLNSKKETINGKNVKDLVEQSFYISIPKEEGINNISVETAVSYPKTSLTLWASQGDKQTQPILIPKNEQATETTTLNVTPTEESEIFDLALRKYITQVNGIDVNNPRTPNPETTKLENGAETTADYNHRKDPVQVEIGDIITYNITVYNEGDIAGRATQITDQLPTGIKFLEVVTNNYVQDSYDEVTNKLVLRKIQENNIPAYTGSGVPSSETVTINCEVTEEIANEVEDKVLTNVAWISQDAHEDGKEVSDRDSQPSTHPQVNKDSLVSSDPDNYKGDVSNKTVTDADDNYFWEGQQDEDDFEKVVVKSGLFDLKLIKKITEINGKEVEERLKNVDTSKLNAPNGETTADYQLDKNPIPVKPLDIVKYTFRIYNEGYIDGYASKITEDIPDGLEFLWSEKTSDEELKAEGYTQAEIEAIKFNQNIGWTYDEGASLKTISTDYLSKERENPQGSGNNLIKAFGANPEGTKQFAEENYKEVSVYFRVTDNAPTGETLRNEAAITEDSDKDGNPVNDRDSKTDDWKKYEDDEDYDNVILGDFDLALRKFITKINDKEITGREPVVDTSKLNTTDENGNLVTTAEYKHTKEPLLVAVGDEVIYTLRVYNEGDTDGYAAEIKDHLPEYLEFVDNEFNKQYGWTVSEDGKTIATDYLKDQLIKKAEKDEDGNIVLSYKDVQIMCKVKDTAKTNYNITNIADITKYEDENHKPAIDRDSKEDNVDPQTEDKKPSYKDDETGDYIPGQEDDDDFEKVVVKIFDLALRKWVTQAIVIENGKQTVTNTGHGPYDNPEQAVKVELNRKKLDQVTVKFRYSIRVINEGNIAGYAKEITDYIPEGLKFVAEDNPQWKDEGNRVISTRALENTLLQPGQYADVEVLLTWENNKDNLGLKTNTAEISEDYNDYGIPDKDSTPDNKKTGEDDIDDAPVLLSVSTGQVRIYYTLGFIILITIAGGIVLIKRFVL